MGKKYIVEIGRLERLYKAFVNGNGKPNMTWLSPEVDLTPYTESDTEQVRKEAYQRGHEAGTQETKEILKDYAEKAYQRGLNDAWEAARTLWNTPARKEIFGYTTFNTVLTTLTAQEAIEKIRQYEREKEEQIQVGDEIETPSGLKGYVVNFTDDELVHYVSSEGRFGTMGMSAVSKTGRHFPEIAEVLQKMKES